jgi:radical SAM superfamily enzyme YgiQ (UPF0313 family)
MSGKRPKVMLIFPKSIYKNFSPPLGLAYLGAVLERKGCSVKIIDMSAPFYEGDLESVINAVGLFKPDIIGVSINTMLIKSAYQIIKTLPPDCALVVAGGPHTSILPHEVLENGFDVAVRGEGENAILQLTQYTEGLAPLENIRGISFRDSKGEIIDNPAQNFIENLDTLPFPAKHLFDKEKYSQNGSNLNSFGSILTSRGCPYSCIYCSKEVYGGKYRTRSANNIYQEIVHLYQNYDLTQINIVDDAFSLNTKKVEELCHLLKKSNLGLQWNCTTRLDFIDDMLLKKMREAGCSNISYGIESGDPETLQKIKKNVTLDVALDGVKKTRKNGISVWTNFMLGFPWEKTKHIRNTLKFIQRLKPYVHQIVLYVPVPFPGTQLYEEYKEDYQLENWWLKRFHRRDLRQLEQMPFFHHIFMIDTFINEADLLNVSFFKYSSHIKKEIKRVIQYAFKNNLINQEKSSLKIKGLVVLVWLSRILYKIHPVIESIGMGFILKTLRITRRILKKV